MANRATALVKISGKLTSAMTNANRISPDIPYMTPRDRIVQTLETAQGKILDAMDLPPAEGRECLSKAFKAVTSSAAQLQGIHGSSLWYRTLATWQLASASKQLAKLMPA